MDESNVTVPNVTEGARSGLAPRQSLLRGSRKAIDTPAEDEEVLKGTALEEAVAAANEAGASIKVSGTADERRAALAEWEADPTPAPEE